MSKSLIAYIASVIVVLYAALFIGPRWKQHGGESTLGWDVSGYYWYLPSIFIYEDLKGQGFSDSVISKYRFTPVFDQASRSDNGGYVLTYSSGMAVLYAPFFAVAHVVAKPLGYPTDGFSAPYQVAISFGSLFVCFIGIWYFRRLLLYYFSDSVTAIVILLLVVGTNYLNYTAIDGALTHNWLFTIYVFLLLATRAYYQTFKTKYAVAIGLLCGMATLVRPSEAVSILLPLLWGIESISLASIRDRVGLFVKRYKQVLLAMVCMAAIGSIQLIYWKYVSGHWLVYSYGSKGFYWTRPHVYDYALSYRSGWLTYTPLMILAIVGIIPFLKYGKNKVAVLSFFVLSFYIVSAWDVWWYGGTGGRAMIQSYPVIFFPFATLIEYMLRKKVWAIVFTPFILLAAYFNIWFTVQAHGGQGLYDPESMTRAYYWKVAGRWHVAEDVMKLKDPTDLFDGEAKDLKLIYSNNLEGDTSLPVRTDAIEGGRSILLNRQRAWSNKYTLPIALGKAGWMRVQACFRVKEKEWTPWLMTQFIAELTNNGQRVKENMLRVHRFLDNGDTRDIFMDIKVPKEHVDSCKIHFWNVESERSILIDDIKVWSFDEGN
jgi:hypothetical protein